MSDVVERLRAMADDVYGSAEAALYREAAAEIERLQAMVALAVETIDAADRERVSRAAGIATRSGQ